MSHLHTRLRLVLLAKDVLQELAWEHQSVNADYENDPAWRALQDAADAVHEAIDIVGGELS